MSAKHEPNGWLAWVLITLVITGFTGWFVAESDNQILLRQLAQAQTAAISREQ